MVDVFWPVSVPVVAITCWFFYMIIQAVMRGRVRELEVRERIAMIERGLVPPPEKDPGGFDRAMHTYETYRDYDEDRDWRGRRAPSRYRSAGVTLMGVGFGMMVLLGFTAGEPSIAIGVGGFLVVMGLAFIINSIFARFAEYRDYRYMPPPRPRPPSSQEQPPR